MRLVHSSAVADFAASAIPDMRVSIPEFTLGQRVQARKNGDTGLIERVCKQTYGENLYIVVWDEFPDDTDWYGCSLLTAVIA